MEEILRKESVTAPRNDNILFSTRVCVCVHARVHVCMCARAPVSVSVWSTQCFGSHQELPVPFVCKKKSPSSSGFVSKKSFPSGTAVFGTAA